VFRNWVLGDALHRLSDAKFYVLLTVHPCIIFFQMKPTRCTLHLSMLISTSLHVSGNYVPIIKWLSGLQTRQPPMQIEKYQCRIGTVKSPDDGHIVARNM